MWESLNRILSVWLPVSPRQVLTPFASSFAMFLSGRAWEVVRNSIAYPELNVKLVATHGGITVGEDGASHQANEDIAIMRAIPDLHVYLPSDYEETLQVVRFAAEKKGPVYIRTGRSGTPVLQRDASYRFQSGKGELRRDGKDATIIACGIMVHEADLAADQLKKEGLDVAVINMASIKPIDAEIIEVFARKTGAIVTAEEHSIVGGLGSAVMEVVCRTHPAPVIPTGVQDRFGQSGKAGDLLNYYGLNAKTIIENVHKAISMKKS